MDALHKIYNAYENHLQDMNHIKKAIAALLVGLAWTAPSADAQSYMFDNPENRTYFGVRAGLDISSAANGGAMFSNKPGFSVGAVYDIPVLANFYFEPGLYIFYNTFGTVHIEDYAYTVTDAQGDETELHKLYQVDGTLRNFGFRIPLNFGYHFDFADNLSLHVFTGPQLNLGLVARYHQNEVITPADQVVKSTSVNAFGTGGFKHFDLQWNFGIGLTYQRYFMSIGGSVGITDMKSASVIQAGPYQVDLRRNIRRNLFNISVGYNF